MKLKTVFISIAPILIAIPVVKYYIDRTPSEIARLEGQAEAIQKTFVPVRFQIIERSEEETEVEVHLYDQAGADLAQFKQKLPGVEPTFGFSILPLREHEHLAFPMKLYSEKWAPKDGIDLFNRYAAEDGFPKIYQNSAYETGEKRKEIIQSFAKLKAGEADQKAYGNDLFSTKAQNLRVGRVYEIHFHPYSGTLDLRDHE